MADVQLVEVRDGADFGDVDVIDAVAGVDDEAERVGLRGSDAEALELIGAGGAVVGVGVGAGVQLDPGRVQFLRQVDLVLVGVDEEAGFDAGGVHGVGDARNLVAELHDIEPALGGDLLAALGHETHGVRLQAERERGHLRRAGHFEIHASGGHFTEALDVAILDVAAVLAEMNGDAVGAGALAQRGERDGVGLDIAADGRAGLTIARLAERGTVVDVDAEEDHGAGAKQDRARQEIRKKLCLPVRPGPEFLRFPPMSPAPAPKRENLLLNLVFNIAVPMLILSKLSDRLGSMNALMLALAFPLGYGVYDFWQRRSVNFVSGLGFFSTLATGGLGLLRLEPLWFAVKEAAVPALIGIAVFVSQWSKRPLVRQFLLNEQVINLPRVSAALDEHGMRPAFEALLRASSVLLAGSFFLSAFLNFALARYLITAAPDTPEFNAQYGRMLGWSWPVIVVPSMAMMMFALWRLVKGVERMTGLTLDQILHSPEEKKDAARVSQEPAPETTNASTSAVETPPQNRS